MRWTRALPWVGAWLVPVLLLSGPIQAQEASSDARRALDEVLADDAYQTELPGKTVVTGEAARGDGEWRSREPRRQVRDDGMLDAGVRALFGFLGPVLRWLLLIAVIVSVVLLLGFLLREAWDSRSDASRAKPPPPSSPPEPDAPPEDREVGPSTLEDVEALAAAGAFGEAVHRLFLLALEGLRQRGRLVLSSAVTGREALRRVDVTEASREGLADLVSAVERFHFADLELTRQDWERSRATYRRLLEAGGGA